MSRARCLIPYLLASLAIAVVLGNALIDTESIGYKDIYKIVLPAGNPEIQEGRAVINYGGLFKIRDVDRFCADRFVIAFRLFCFDPQGFAVGFTGAGHKGYRVDAQSADFQQYGVYQVEVRGQEDRYYVLIDGVIRDLWKTPDRNRGDFFIDGLKSDLRIDDLTILAESDGIAATTWSDDFERGHAAGKPFLLFVTAIVLALLVWHFGELLFFWRLFRFDRSLQATSLLWSALVAAGLMQAGAAIPGFEWLIPGGGIVFFYLRLRFFFTSSNFLDLEAEGKASGIWTAVLLDALAAFGLFFLSRAAFFQGQAACSFGRVAPLLPIFLFLLVPFAIHRRAQSSTLGRAVSVFGRSAFSLAWLGLMALLFSSREGFGRMASWSLPFALLIYFLPLRANRRHIRGYGLFMLVMAVAVAFGVETALRLHPFSARFRPMNIGANYDEDDLLFWVPKGFFPQGEDFHLAADPSVRKVAFRSGEVPMEKPEGEFRIMALGASNVWGDGIEKESETFPAVLETLADAHSPKARVRVINAGVPGYNSFQVRLFFEKYGVDYRPDLVVVYLGRNDATGIKGIYTFRELYEMAAQPRMKMIRQTQKILSRSALYNGWTRSITGMRNATHRSAFDDDLLKVPVPPEDFQANLEAIVRTAKSAGAQVVLASEFWGEPFLFLKEFDAAGFYGNMELAALQEGAFFYDAYRDMAANYPLFDVIFRDDVVHLNPHGHRELGRRLFEYLRQQGLLPEK